MLTYISELSEIISPQKEIRWGDGYTYFQGLAINFLELLSNCHRNLIIPFYIYLCNSCKYFKDKIFCESHFYKWSRIFRLGSTVLGPFRWITVHWRSLSDTLEFLSSKCDWPTLWQRSSWTCSVWCNGKSRNQRTVTLTIIFLHLI